MRSWSQPNLRQSLLIERGDPVLAALAVRQNVSAGPEVHVGPAQAGQFADPQAGGDRDLYERVVATSGRRVRVGGA